MKDIRNAIKKGMLYFDGGFGTMVEALGLSDSNPPELLNLTHPDKVTQIHDAYLKAGSRIVTANTFGINQTKYENYEELICAAIRCAKNATKGYKDCFVAMDIGPTGRMLAPLGDLPFEEAVSIFSANVRAAVKCGVDLILIETMNDAYETKAAVLAAKENCDLPIFVTNAYDKSGKLMTGADPLSMIAMLEGLSVDAIGMNCSFGPDAMLSIIDQFTEHCSLPLIANPNAGLPQVIDGETVYTVSPEEFASYMVRLAEKGVTILGGCCGTTPSYIEETVRATAHLPFTPPKYKNETLISSYTHAVRFGKKPVLIGERINPTGKPKLKDALREGNLSYILNEGVRQADAGVAALDVNVGLPEINEIETMHTVVSALQEVTDLPLQLDSTNPLVLEAAMRIYNGKPLINSVNGDEASMRAIFPLVKKYGGAVIVLTMDKNGIPDTAEGRLAIAKRVAAVALEYGIGKKDLIVDPLCLTVSSNPDSALVTLKAVKLLSSAGFMTGLGVSNISFGLPAREKINACFFAAALENGLSSAIMNPFSQGMMDTYYAYNALHGLDFGCSDYIGYAERAAEKTEAAPTTLSHGSSLQTAIIKGLKQDAVSSVTALLQATDPLTVINDEMIPALNRAGKSFEEQKTYLPQLLMSAEAAAAAFEIIKDKMPRENTAVKKEIVLATVKGDIHDIGKNIVKVLLESYGFTVYDLGRDVEPSLICESVAKTGCRLVGLSALMTTTVPAMEKTVSMLHQRFPDCKVIVGGAVLTQEYAKQIHADGYGRDAMAAVHYAEQYYTSQK